MTSALLDQLGLGGAAGASAPAAPAGADLPPSIPDPEPHLADPSTASPDMTGQSPVDAPAPAVDHAATTEVDSLQNLLGLAHDYMAIPTVQPDEKHKMAKAVTIITDLLSGNQKTRDSITGANPALRKLPGASGA